VDRIFTTTLLTAGSSCKKAGAGNETRTRDLNLGKVALYQLSYSRVGGAYYGMQRRSQPVLFDKSVDARSLLAIAAICR
jgi:hypothetical protein